MRIANIVGARPNFMKIAPLMKAYRAYPHLQPVLIHTGQHYDHAMSHLFFEQLQIPRPDLNLEVGSGSHAVQTAGIMIEFERYCLHQRPDMVLVVGDVNSTIACALVASKLGIKIAHVEAGLRSFDRSMPEEINRLLTDAVADLLFVSEPSGIDNLQREGVDSTRIHFVGNLMIDTLLANLSRAEEEDILERLKLKSRSYAVLTLHRPANVDDPRILRGLFDVISEVTRDLNVVFPVHPRTLAQIKRYGFLDRLSAMSRLTLVPPLGYLPFLKLTAHARIMLTDSGGIQEETAVLKIPCITLRENTERPVTCSAGTNLLAGTDPTQIINAYRKMLEFNPATCRTPERWDGRAAERIAAILAEAIK